MYSRVFDFFVSLYSRDFLGPSTTLTFIFRLRFGRTLLRIQLINTFYFVYRIYKTLSELGTYRSILTKTVIVELVEVERYVNRRSGK